MSDIADFEKLYKQDLDAAIAGAGLPPELLQTFSFESCLRRDRTGRKELYIVRRLVDGVQGTLRITFNCPEEDALEEAKLLEHLDHPAIPKVLATYEEPQGRKYIVREYIPGHTLYEVVKTGGTLPVRDIYAIALQICDVLAYLHKQKPPVIHRDIKPQNIIIDPAGGVHLIDFGIAREHKEGQSQDTAIILSEGYAPPEQFGFGQTSQLTDIYALGVVMLFMATGQREKTGIGKQITDKNLCTIIERAIAFDPKDRFQSVEAMTAAIRRYHGEKKPLHRAVIGIGLALLLVATALPSYYFGYRAGDADAREALAGTTTGGTVAAGSLDLPAVAFDEEMGNLAGNTKNGGLACRSENEIYYIKDDSIYTMGLDGSNPRIAALGVGPKDINYYNGYVYFTTNSGIRRFKPEEGTAQPESYTDVGAENIYIRGSNMYFTNSEDELRLYKVNEGGGGVTKMNDINAAVYKNIHGDRMYFSLYKDGNKMFSCRLDGSDLVELTDKGATWLCVYGDKIYYCGDSLMRMNLDGTGAETVASGSANFIVACETGIFYTSMDSGRHSLEWCSLDGSLRKTILKDDCSAFNVVGDWIFYENENENDAVWRVKLDGTENQAL